MELWELFRKEPQMKGYEMSAIAFALFALLWSVVDFWAVWSRWKRDGSFKWPRMGTAIASAVAMEAIGVLIFVVSIGIGFSSGWNTMSC